jgi:hypothetical protein
MRIKLHRSMPIARALCGYIRVVKHFELELELEFPTYRFIPRIWQFDTHL